MSTATVPNWQARAIEAWEQAQTRLAAERARETAHAEESLRERLEWALERIGVPVDPHQQIEFSDGRPYYVADGLTFSLWRDYYTHRHEGYAVVVRYCDGCDALISSPALANVEQLGEWLALPETARWACSCTSAPFDDC